MFPYNKYTCQCELWKFIFRGQSHNDVKQEATICSRASDIERIHLKTEGTTDQRMQTIYEYENRVRSQLRLDVHRTAVT